MRIPEPEGREYVCFFKTSSITAHSLVPRSVSAAHFAFAGLLLHRPSFLPLCDLGDALNFTSLSNAESEWAKLLLTLWQFSRQHLIF